MPYKAGAVKAQRSPSLKMFASCFSSDGASADSHSAASDQRSTTPMTSHRIKDRRKPVRSGVLVSVFGIAVTFQNNSLGWVAAD